MSITVATAMASAAPINCEMMKPGAPLGAIPANVSDSERCGVKD
jgi:hypothetical protein